MNTETQNHTPGDWHLVKDRLVTQPDPPNGPYIRLALFLPLASQADKDLIARAPALLAENAWLQATVDTLAEENRELQDVAAKHRAENARLREALLDIEANLQGEDCLRERRLDSLRRVRAALAGERSEKV